MLGADAKRLEFGKELGAFLGFALLTFARLDDVEIEFGVGIDQRGSFRIAVRFFDRDEVDVGGAGAGIDVALVSGAGAFGIEGAPLGVGEVEVFDGFEEAEVLLHIGEGTALLEGLEDAGFDGGSDGAEEGVGALLVADVGRGGDLGEDGQR